MPLSVDGRFNAQLERHSQLNESDALLVPHNNVWSTVCGDNLLWEVEWHIRQVSGDMLGGWEVLHQEGMNGQQDGIVSGIVPPLLQSTGTGIEDVEQSLALATEVAGWRMQLLPQVQICIVWESVCEGVQGKLEDSFREGCN